MTERLRGYLDTGNLIRYLLSFVLAFTLWAWVTAERDPEQTFQANQLEITIINVPEDLQIVGSLPTVDVTLQGPRSVIQDIDTGSIIPTIDLSEADGPGSYTAEVEVDEPDDIRKVTTDPEEVTVELDSVVTAVFPIELLDPTSVPRNLLVTNRSATPNEVTITGVQQNVDQVERVVVDVSLAGQNNSFGIDAVPRPVDRNNQLVENVTVTPATVRVNVVVAVRGKVVPVFVRCECTAADGYTVVGQPLATPDTVLIDGPPDQLAAVQFIYTTPIDTSGLTSTDVIENVLLDTTDLPEGVTVEPSEVNVSVRVEQATEMRTIDAVPVLLVNVPEGFEASVNPTTVAMSIEGPGQEIDALTAEDIGLIVDLSGAEAGQTTVTPRVLLPPRVRYSQAPPQVTVTLVQIVPTPTATTEPPPPPPTATATSSP